jgi:hypothetical protein
VCSQHSASSVHATVASKQQRPTWHVAGAVQSLDPLHVEQVPALHAYPEQHGPLAQSPPPVAH